MKNKINGKIILTNILSMCILISTASVYASKNMPALPFRSGEATCEISHKNESLLPIDKIESLLSKQTMEIIDNFRNSPKKPVVYTSFDGDDMNHMLKICKNVLDENKIPLNPEMALGYYISTCTLGGSKINVMTDCLTLAMFSDEFQVNGNSEKLLSEGIMAEAFLWHKIKNKGAKFINDLYSYKYTEFDCDQLHTYLEKTMDKKFEGELLDCLLDKYNSETHKTVYIGANFVNYKHLDWARVKAFQEGICPISPQNILSYFLYKNSGKEMQYLIDRLTLLDKCDNYWLCIDKSNFGPELEKLDQNTLAELYFLNKFKPETTINLIDWADIGVPKYKCKDWALTSKEKMECHSDSRINSIKDKIRDSYNSNSYLKDYRNRQILPFEKMIFDKIINLIPQSASILDLGCGNGYPYDDYFKIKGFKNLIGVDFSEKNIYEARINNPCFQYKCEDIEKYNFGKNHNLIMALFSIIHLPRENHNLVFKKIYDALSEGGIFLLTLRDEDSGPIKYKKDFCQQEMYWSYYDFNTYKEMLEKIGFKILYKENQNLFGLKESHNWVILQK